MTKTHRFAHMPIGILAGLLLTAAAQPGRAMHDLPAPAPAPYLLPPPYVAQLGSGGLEDGGGTGGGMEEEDAQGVAPPPDIAPARQFCFAIVPRTDCPTRCRKFLLLSNDNTLELNCTLRTDCNQGTTCP